MATMTKKTASRTPRKPGLGRLPVKRDINLAAVGVKPINMMIAIPAIALIILGAILLSKVAVVDRYMAVSRAEGEVNELRRRLDESYAQIDSYGELSSRYAHYTYSDMTREELERVDRIDVIDMIDKVVLGDADMPAWSVTGDQLTLTVRARSLSAVNAIAQQLMQEPIVNYCSVAAAATGSDFNRYYVSDPEDDGWVTAQVTVILNSALEVTNR